VPPRSECLEINALALEAIDLTNDELVMNSVSVQMKLAKDSLLIEAAFAPSLTRSIIAKC
jgi:hypothetical protein